MGVAGVADVATAGIGEALGVGYLLDAGIDHLGALSPEFGGIGGINVDALLGQAGVEVEGVPSYGERIVLAACDNFLPGRDGVFEAVLADVALGRLDGGEDQGW